MNYKQQHLPTCQLRDRNYSQFARLLDLFSLTESLWSHIRRLFVNDLGTLPTKRTEMEIIAVLHLLTYHVTSVVCIVTYIEFLTTNPNQ